jgi:hypothetical protein
MSDTATHHHSMTHHASGITRTTEYDHAHADGERPHAHESDDPSVIKAVENDIAKVNNAANKADEDLQGNAKPTRYGWWRE